MARAIEFEVSGQNFDATCDKVDRTKLYGRTQRIPESSGKRCYLGRLSDDGLHLLGKDTLQDAYLDDDDGEWMEPKVTLAAKSKALVKTPSSHDGVVVLSDVVSMDDYLMYVAKSVYHIVASADFIDVIAKCRGIYTFKYNYSASIDQDDAFLINNNGVIFLVVGERLAFNFIGLTDVASTVLDDEEDDDDEDDIDFAM